MVELRAADPTKLQRRNIPMEFRVVDETAEEGIVEGYGSVFNVLEPISKSISKGVAG